MRTEKVKISRLLPIEYFFRNGSSYFARMIECVYSLPPISLVPFDRDFIVVDGHHTTIAHLASGRKDIIGDIMETDNDVNRYNNGALMYRDSIFSVVTSYRAFWRPECSDRGIYTFNDLFEKYRDRLTLPENL